MSLEEFLNKVSNSLKSNPVAVIVSLIVVLVVLLVLILACGEHMTNRNGPDECASYLSGYTGSGGLRKCTMRQDSSLNFSARGPN